MTSNEYKGLGVFTSNGDLTQASTVTKLNPVEVLEAKIRRYKTEMKSTNVDRTNEIVDLLNKKAMLEGEYSKHNRELGKNEYLDNSKQEIKEHIEYSAAEQEMIRNATEKYKEEHIN